MVLYYAEITEKTEVLANMVHSSINCTDQAKQCSMSDLKKVLFNIFKNVYSEMRIRCSINSLKVGNLCQSSILLVLRCLFKIERDLLLLFSDLLISA